MLAPPFDAWTLRDLEAVVAIGQQGSFIAAARILQISRSSVTRSVARLERDLGATLFQRTTRQVRVTDTGSRFLLRAESALRELMEAAQEAREAEGVAVGRLRVACSATFGAQFLVPHLASFQERHPGVELDLRFSDRRVDLLNDEIDVAIRLGELEDSSLILHRIAAEQRWLYASPKYLAQFGSPQNPGDLREHKCLFLGDDCRWRFHVAGEIEVLEVGGGMRTDLGVVLVQTALAGMGIARLSAWAAHDALEDGRLVRVLPELTVGSCGVIGAIYPPSKVFPRKLSAFLSFLDEELGPVVKRTLLPIVNS
ncbi:MAG: LysR substrate-binding domain-containing protein [Planctomycetota bacterium]|nr:LysR substrate-binding domain-containing protein [Planctomycetota bacterium]